MKSADAMDFSAILDAAGLPLQVLAAIAAAALLMAVVTIIRA
jgi:hypothetical protein